MSSFRKLKGPASVWKAALEGLWEADHSRNLENVLALMSADEETAEIALTGEQTIVVPDFVDAVFLVKSKDPGLIAPDRRAFLLVEDAEQGPPKAVAIAIGLEGAVPPM